MFDRVPSNACIADLRSTIGKTARAVPTKTALVDTMTGESLAYEGLRRATDRVAARLRDVGISPGERVALIGTNSIDFAVSLLATMLSGAVAMPLSPHLPEEAVDRLLGHADCRCVFGSDRRGTDRESLSLSAWRVGPSQSGSSEPIEPEADALLIYTSGTTGDPKGVMLTHGALCANATAAIEAYRLDGEHRTLALLPLFHTFALVSDVLSMLLCGGSVVIAPSFEIRDLARIEGAIRTHGVCSFSAVPLIFDVMTRLRADLRGERMKFCVSGAAPLTEETREAFHALQGFPILPAYGLTEACCFCSITAPDRVVPGSCGVPVGELRVLDESDRDCAAGECGELVIRGPNVIRQGYYRDDRDCYVQGDWFRTGDLGTLDDAGNLYVTGRLKNMVIRGGEKVYLDDIDSCLKRNASVADSRTVGLLDRTPERIVTFVVPRGDATEMTRLTAWLAAELGAGSTPDEIRTVESIPYTKTGKAQIAVLQALAAEAP